MYIVGFIRNRAVLLLLDDDGGLWDGADLVDPGSVTVLATLEIDRFQPLSVRLRAFDRQ